MQSHGVKYVCYLYNAVHLVHNTGLLHSVFFDNFTLHYIVWALYNAFLSNADFSRHKKPRCSRPLCIDDFDDLDDHDDLDDFDDFDDLANLQ